MTRAHWGAIALLILIPMLADAGLLSGWSDCNLELLYGQDALSVVPSRFPGSACVVDPAVAYLTQPLGYLSAQDWLHGIIPWWNPLNGVGMPLAAEMQNESFFLPFVLLLHFPQGWFLQRLVFQILSGLFTYALLIELSLTSGAAILGGILFSLNATFILTAGTVAAPIFFLPLTLLGIEHARRAATEARPMGWSLITIGLAGSLYAGFPETAYIDGLLCASWATLRLFQLTGATRWSLAGKLGLAAAIGLALTAPLSLPFLSYLRAGGIGAHADILPSSTLPAAAAPLSLLPLAYGALDLTPALPGFTFQGMWVRIGGWYGCAPVFLALYSLVPKSSFQPERLLLAAWAAVWQARFFGAPGLIAAIKLVPGMNVIDCIRYAPLSVEFAIFSLAAFGLDDCLRRRPRPRTHLLWPTIAFTACLAASLIAALPALRTWFSPEPELPHLVHALLRGHLGPLQRWHGHLLQPWLRGVALLSTLLSIATVLALAIAVQLRRALWLAPTLMAFGSIAMFLLPQICAPRSGQRDDSAIQFLHAQPGFWRFFTAAPLAPNYGAAYQLASINYVQLPAPKLWADYIQSNLFPGADKVVFGGAQAGQMAALFANLPNYEQTGVKYILTAPRSVALLKAITPPSGAKDAPPSPSSRISGSQTSAPMTLPVPVFESQSMIVFELPNPAPYAETSAPCALATITRQSMSVHCAKPAILLRRELYFPGWRAAINGATVPIAQAGIFQRVELPAGPAQVRFTYMPPGTVWNCMIALAAALAWLACAAWRRRSV